MMKAYEKGEGIVWMSERMNRKESTINGMAMTLRKAGVRLPTFRRKHIEIVSVRDMNQLIREKLL